MTQTKAIPAKAVKTDILTIRKVLTELQITLPDYQRPYKWQSDHVRQLLSDLRYHQRKNAYRLGSFVFHAHDDRDPEKLHIVDGQQRLVTLLLIISAIQTKAPALIKPAFTSLFDKIQFSHEKSRENIARNYQEILNDLDAPSEDFVRFLLDTCEVVCFTLSRVNEAFQFFDSQNARGRALDPHDLLKAYHLREFSPADEHLKYETVSQWEAIEEKDDSDLKHLFGDYLYRIRQWSRGQRAQHFRSRDIAVFKGISPENDFPHLRALKIAHHFVNDYNAQFSRRIDQQAMSYPFGLDQTILNGRRFFDMVTHYQRQGFHQGGVTRNDVIATSKLSDTAKKIITKINEYEGSHRTGDRYIRNLFDCLLMYYCDKFGDAQLSSAIEKIFIWAYTLRLEKHAVQWATVENHVKADNRFVTLRDSCRPEDFLSKPCRPLGEIKREITSIQALFPPEFLPKGQGK